MLLMYILLRTSVLTAARAGSRSGLPARAVRLPARAVLALVHVVLIRVTV